VSPPGRLFGLGQARRRSLFFRVVRHSGQYYLRIPGRHIRTLGLGCATLPSVIGAARGEDGAGWRIGSLYPDTSRDSKRILSYSRGIRPRMFYSSTAANLQTTGGRRRRIGRGASGFGLAVRTAAPRFENRD